MSSSDDLVTRQVRRWELARRLRERFARDAQEAHGRQDLLTVSRERGSGGTLIGLMVAKELDWEFYDRKLIDQIAEQISAHPRDIEAHDEQAPRSIHNFILNLLERGRPTETQYLRGLVRTLRRLRRQGNAVVMGRGANLVIPDALSIRVVAPLEKRIERIAELEDLPLDEARQVVMKADRERRQFVRAYFKADAADPLLYDLTINTSATNLEHAAALVITALRNRQETS